MDVFKGFPHLLEQRQGPSLFVCSINHIKHTYIFVNVYNTRLSASAREGQFYSNIKALLKIASLLYEFQGRSSCFCNRVVRKIVFAC